MNASSADRDWAHPAFFENQRNFPKERLAQYGGRHIAWSWDGSTVLDSDSDEGTLYDRIVAAGNDPSRVVFDYVPPADLSLL